METVGARILVVDDDKGIREFLTLQLSTAGYTVFTADCVKKAKDVIQDNPEIDLILLDVIMPGPSGFDLLKDLKSDPKNSQIPIIMVTALGLVQDKELAFMLGAGDYLTKPFDSREMLARIRTHISLKRKTNAIYLSNQTLSTILATVPGIVYMKNAERKFIHVNQAFEELCGKKLNEIIGRNDEEVFTQDVAEITHRSEDLIFSYEVPFLENVENIPDISGEIRSFLFRRQPVRNAEGIISGLVGVGVDLTEQIMLRTILSDREAYLSTLMNTFPARIWAINKEGYFTQQNGAHIERWGYLIGKRIEDIASDEIVKNGWISDYEIAIAGNSVNKILPGLKNDTCVGVVRWINPIYQDNEIIGVLGISFDISEGFIRKIRQVLKERNDTNG